MAELIDAHTMAVSDVSDVSFTDTAGLIVPGQYWALAYKYGANLKIETQLAEAVDTTDLQ
ncbi:hypothetical protein HB779_02060 [Phyllobacterium sp. 628]|uniref:hypothetical protein n=1 Tax=Phyllobacterium sp. 628 TaxID=2718938 RepID=UPI00166221B9|nr:hypothetical protein [Phyllobacterium sp. 628]QND50806.1 hypothetical protein HB779_02060 [Phyllobacterium sp. 628]